MTSAKASCHLGPPGRRTGAVFLLFLGKVRPGPWSGQGGRLVWRDSVSVILYLQDRGCGAGTSLPTGPGEGASEPMVLEDHMPSVCASLLLGLLRIPCLSSLRPCISSSPSLWLCSLEVRGDWRQSQALLWKGWRLPCMREKKGGWRKRGVWDALQEAEARAVSGQLQGQRQRRERRWAEGRWETLGVPGEPGMAGIVPAPGTGHRHDAGPGWATRSAECTRARKEGRPVATPTARGRGAVAAPTLRLPTSLCSLLLSRCHPREAVRLPSLEMPRRKPQWTSSVSGAWLARRSWWWEEPRACWETRAFPNVGSPLGRILV